MCKQPGTRGNEKLYGLLGYGILQQTLGSGNNKLTVTGTLKCPATLQPAPPDPGAGLPAFCDGNADCILNLGIAEQQGQCSKLFPVVHLDPRTGLAAGQVLSFSQTVAGSNCPDESQANFTWLNTNNSVLQLGNLLSSRRSRRLHTRQNQEPLTGAGFAEAALQFDVTFIRRGP